MSSEIIEINFKRGNIVKNSIEISLEEWAIIREGLVGHYLSVNDTYDRASSSGLTKIASDIFEYKNKIKDLVGKLQ